jgi:hypothetical protein
VRVRTPNRTAPKDGHAQTFTKKTGSDESLQVRMPIDCLHSLPHTWCAFIELLLQRAQTSGGAPNGAGRSDATTSTAAFTTTTATASLGCRRCPGSRCCWCCGKRRRSGGGSSGRRDKRRLQQKVHDCLDCPRLQGVDGQHRQAIALGLILNQLNTSTQFVRARPHS